MRLTHTIGSKTRQEYANNYYVKRESIHYEPVNNIYASLFAAESRSMITKINNIK